GLGVVAFFAFTGALAAPWLIERIGGAWLGTHEHEHEDGHEHGHGHGHEHEHEHGRPGADRTHGAKAAPSATAARLATELSFGALLLHQVGDGVALHHYATGDEPSLDAALALSLHTVPVAALVVLRFSQGAVGAGAGARAWRPGLVRAAWLAVATLAGIALGATFVSTWLQAAGPWTAAIVSGLLLHVLTHDLGRDAPRTTSERMLELAGLVGGLAIAVGALALGAHEHDHGHDPAGAAGHGHEALPTVVRIGHAMLDVALAVSPWALAGLVASAVIGATTRAPSLDAPSSGRIATVVWLLRRSAQARGPSELAPVTVLASFALLGGSFVLARVAGLVVMATALALVPSTRPPVPEGGEGRSTGTREAGSEPGADTEPRRALASRIAYAFDRTLHANAPSLAFGIALAGLMHGIVPADALGGAGHLPSMMLVWMLLAVATLPDGLLATPVGAALTTRGLPTSAAACAMLIASVRRGGAFDRAQTSRAGWPSLAAVALGIGATFAVQHVWPSAPFVAHIDGAHDHGVVQPCAAALLGVALLLHLYRCGLRAWIATASGTRHRHET
ncbi:MAG: hypothetical protein IT379_26200, partial [Deltaproteobacteria bacterium]|nr:hypothetical protein [Deltaproteobacteria bacterium]